VTFYARKRSNGLTMRMGVLVPIATVDDARMLYGDPALRGLALPSTADPDKVEARAAKAAAARDMRAVETHRAEGTPVRGYRSRKGRTVPGYSPTVRPL
jgi:hypothetical protein